MNSSNALGFLVLGSLMNAAPALVPSMFSHGIMIVSDMTPSALWVHFMGLTVGLIGSGHLLKEGLVSYRVASRAALRHVRAGAAAPARAVSGSSLQTA